MNPVLKFLQFHFVYELARHLVSLELLFFFVLQVAANYVENVVFEDKTVAQTTLVTHCSDQHIFTLGDDLTADPAKMVHEWLFDEDDQEHLVHRNEAILRVDVIESLLTKEKL